MDKYMEQAIHSVVKEFDCSAAILREQMCMDPNKLFNNGEYKVALVRSRASELRLLDMLRHMHDPEFCPYEECNVCALLADYKDVKTD